MCAAQGVDRERCVMVVKTECVNRWKDMHASKKDHENCNRTGKNMHFIMKTLLI